MVKTYNGHVIIKWENIDTHKRSSDIRQARVDGR